MQDSTKKHFGDVGILNKYEVHNDNINNKCWLKNHYEAINLNTCGIKNFFDTPCVSRTVMCIVEKN